MSIITWQLLYHDSFDEFFFFRTIKLVLRWLLRSEKWISRPTIRHTTCQSLKNSILYRGCILYVRLETVLRLRKKKNPFVCKCIQTGKSPIVYTYDLSGNTLSLSFLDEINEKHYIGIITICCIEWSSEGHEIVNWKKNTLLNGFNHQILWWKEIIFLLLLLLFRKWRMTTRSTIKY